MISLYTLIGAEPKAWSKKCAKSRSVFLPQPSTMFSGIRRPGLTCQIILFAFREFWK
jgi:hypothetical protein